MTREAYSQTRIFENKLKLATLLDGVKNHEFRVWKLSSFYDSQVVFIAKSESSNRWTLRKVSFNRAKPDSVFSDFVRILGQGAIDSLNLERYWQLTSQSDLGLGDSFGCNDGGDIFIEMANPWRYRFMWHRCPDIHKDNDPSFRLTSELADKLNALAFDH